MDGGGINGQGRRHSRVPSPGEYGGAVLALARRPGDSQRLAPGRSEGAEASVPRLRQGSVDRHASVERAEGDGEVPGRAGCEEGSRGCWRGAWWGRGRAEHREHRGRGEYATAAANSER